MYFSLRMILEQGLCFLYPAAREQLSSMIEIASSVSSVLHGVHAFACEKTTYHYQERAACG